MALNKELFSVEEKDESIPEKVLFFRAWFDDGYCYTGELDDWLLLPRDGMLAVAVYRDNNTTRTHMGADFYFYFINSLGYPVFASTDEQPTAILGRYPSANIIRGAWTDDVTIQKVAYLVQKERE